MVKFDRIYHLHHLLKSRRLPVSLGIISKELECSERTSRRIIASIKDYLGAPIEYLREQNGYRYARDEKSLYELPGLWFSPDELYALMVSYKLLTDLQPGLLGTQISPIKNRIEQMLAKQQVSDANLGEKIRIFQIASRPTNLKHFRDISTALMKGKRLRVLYHGRSRDTTTQRTVSPQRLIYYRSNWYLDAWCHLRNELRSFSLDRLHPVETNKEDTKKISADALDAHFQPTYGIFTGTAKHIAILKFNLNAAKWVADEKWHPEQKGRTLKDGSYELAIPYSDDRELIMDIMKYGSDVKVIEPDALKNKVLQKYQRAIKQYQ
jgi:predicted DNA-binding transcriptional regulator YafY